MSEKEEVTTSKKLSAFLDNNRKFFWIALAYVILGVAGFIVGEAVGSAAKKNDLEKIDAISFALTDGSAALETDVLDARRDTALNSLAGLNKKSGIVGVRANMLSAELYYQKENYEAALECWKSVAAKSKKSYTAPIAYYNAASCYEKLNKIDDAAEYYKKAADNNDFVLQLHAKFSYGRVLETKGDYAQAVSVYNELSDIDPENQWAKLGKTRVIALQAEGKAE